MNAKEATDIINEVCNQQRDHGIFRQAINALIPAPDKIAFIAGFNFGQVAGNEVLDPEEAWKLYNGWNP